MKHRLLNSLLCGALLLALLPAPVPVAAENPLLIQTAKLTNTTQAAIDNHGYSVAIDGNVIVVGAPFFDLTTNGNQGAVFVYQMGANGWADMTQTVRLSASDAANDDYFGWSVAIDGDVIVVGAPRKDSPSAVENVGKAYVFEKGAGGWGSAVQSAALSLSSPVKDDEFGYSVALDGGTLAAAAHRESSNRGGVYVYERPAGGWSGLSTPAAHLTASDGAAGDYFGEAISLDGSVLAVGAYRDDVGAASNQGSAYIFEKSGASWSQSAKLTASNGAASDVFGTSIALDGDTLAVGAPAKNTSAGAAYTFTRGETGWAAAVQQAIPAPSPAAAFEYFGQSVSLDGDTLLVGAPQKSVNTDGAIGAAFLYTRSASTWTPKERKYNHDGAVGDKFGWSVAIDNYTAVVGAVNEDAPAEDSGAAYVFSPGMVYMEPGGVCEGKRPCYDTFAAAQAAAAEGDGFIFLMPAAPSAWYGEAITLTRNIKVALDEDSPGMVILQAPLDIQNGIFFLNRDLLTISDLTLGENGTFGGLTDTTLYMGNRGLQTIDGDFTFYNLQIDPTSVVDVGSSLLTIIGELGNGGVMRRSAPARDVTAGSGSVGFQDAVSGPAVSINLADGSANMGATTVEVSMHEHPPLCNGQPLGMTPVLRHYTITPANAAGVSADIQFYFRGNIPGNAELDLLGGNPLIVMGCSAAGWKPLNAAAYPKIFGPDHGYLYVEAAGVQEFSAFAVVEPALLRLPLVRR